VLATAGETVAVHPTQLDRRLSTTGFGIMLLARVHN
jgi:hypothetical protein